MAINFTPFAEGEDLDASSINSRFTTLRDYANAVDAEGVERHSLRAEHLPGLVPTDLFTGGLYQRQPSDEPREAYDNRLPGATTATTGYPLNYQAFSSAAPSAPYGPPTALDRTGWRILAEANASADAAEVTADSNLTLATWRLKGLLVRGSYFLNDTDGTLWSDGAGGLGSTPDYYLESALIAIGFEDGAGARFCIERTVRWYSIRAIWKGELVTSTLITQSDIDAGDGQIKKVFLLTAKNARAITGNVDGGVAHPEIGQYQIMVWPLHADDLPTV